MRSSSQTNIPKDSGESRYKSLPQIKPRGDGNVGANPEGVKRIIEPGKFPKITR
jgi:hypothetical protein